MIALVFEICLTAAFGIALAARLITAVTFEFGYDEFLIAGLAFGLGMLIRDWTFRRS